MSPTTGSRIASYLGQTAVVNVQPHIAEVAYRDNLDPDTALHGG